MTDRPADTPKVPATGKQMTDDEIEAMWVEPIQPLVGPIVLAEPDPAWPGLFAREEARIRSILGERVVRLEHTGSTSVPGLAAKPVIDITMTVADVLDEPAYATDLEAAGYRLVIREQEPEWYDHRVFKGPDTNINLHVHPPGSPEIPRMRGFRDYLRAHDEARLEYEAEKRRLAAQDWEYVQHYADAKSRVVETILARVTPAETDA